MYCIYKDPRKSSDTGLVQKNVSGSRLSCWHYFLFSYFVVMTVQGCACGFLLLRNFAF